MRSIQLLFIESKVEGHVILFAIFLTGTCLSQTLIIFVGIALFASIAVLQTTVNLVLEGINTRSFHCCSKVLKHVHIMRKGENFWNTFVMLNLSFFSLLTSILMVLFYIYTVVYGRTLEEHWGIVHGIWRSSSLNNVIKTMSSNVTSVFCRTIK